MQLQPISRVAPSVALVTGACEHAREPLSDGAPARAPGLPWLLIRRLGQGHHTALARHLIGLPPGDRRLRFSGVLTDEAVRRHCDGLDLDGTICFAALGEADEVMGAALGFECGAGAGGGGQGRVEVAVSVAPEHRALRVRPAQRRNTGLGPAPRRVDRPVRGFLRDPARTVALTASPRAGDPPDLRAATPWFAPTLSPRAS